MAYAIGDLASLAVVTDKVSGVGLNATVTEVSFLFRSSWTSLRIIPESLRGVMTGGMDRRDESSRLAPTELVRSLI